MDINKFKYMINLSYSKETCFNEFQEFWDEKNKSFGHCVLVALKFYEIFGGDIIKVDIENSNVGHYYNVINNEKFDITGNQFKNNEKYLNPRIKKYEDILKDKELIKRYKIFSNKFNSILISLDSIDKKILTCSKCYNLVEKFNHHTSVYYGTNNKLLIVGEAPANNGWRKSGKCWYDVNGKLTGSGKTMSKLLTILNLKLEDVSFIEAIKCYPLSRNNLSVCKNNCYSYLENQIRILNPKVILTLGDTATRSLIKNISYNNFSEVVGKELSVSIDNSLYTVIPIYHPSPISPKGYKDNVPIFERIKELI